MRPVISIFGTSTVECARATILLIPSSSFLSLRVAFPRGNRHFRSLQNIKTDKSHFFSHFHANSLRPSPPLLVISLADLPLHPIANGRQQSRKPSPRTAAASTDFSACNDLYRVVPRMFEQPGGQVTGPGLKSASALAKPQCSDQVFRPLA